MLGSKRGDSMIVLGAALDVDDREESSWIPRDQGFSCARVGDLTEGRGAQFGRGQWEPRPMVKDTARIGGVTEAGCSQLHD
jgi:hypothetical protein